MRVTLIVSASKFTGAAAVAELCCRALHRAGVGAELLFLAGRNLETRLAGKSWARAGLVKERRPRHLFANIGAIRRAAARSEVVITHLPHDHMLCRLAGAHRSCLMVRSFRNSKHLRSGPYNRLLASKTSASLLPHSGLETRLPGRLKERPSMILPAPVEDRFDIGHDPGRWRTKLGLAEDAPLIGMVGKIAAGRGFDTLVECVPLLPPETHAVAIGVGEARPALEERAARLGVAEQIHWAGYQEDELPALFAAVDLVLFTAAGSDHGHRAISEAQACGRPVLAVDIPGVASLITDGVDGRIVANAAPSIAAEAAALFCDRHRLDSMTMAAAEAVGCRRFEPLGEMLAGFLRQLTLKN